LSALARTHNPAQHGAVRDGFARFRPRFALAIVAGLGLFVIATLLYALPAMLEPVPAGAIAGYTQERVRARLEGKVLWLLGGSLALAGAVGAWIGRGDP
jgi:hypothetical protein